MTDPAPPLVRHDITPHADRVEITTTANGIAGAPWHAPTMGVALRFAVWLMANAGNTRPMVFVSGRRLSMEALRGRALYHSCREHVSRAGGRRPKLVLPVDLPAEGLAPLGEPRFTAVESAARSTHDWPDLE